MNSTQLQSHWQGHQKTCTSAPSPRPSFLGLSGAVSGARCCGSHLTPVIQWIKRSSWLEHDSQQAFVPCALQKPCHSLLWPQLISQTQIAELLEQPMAGVLNSSLRGISVCPEERPFSTETDQAQKGKGTSSIRRDATDIPCFETQTVCQNSGPAQRCPFLKTWLFYQCGMKCLMGQSNRALHYSDGLQCII